MLQLKLTAQSEAFYCRLAWISTHVWHHCLSHSAFSASAWRHHLTVSVYLSVSQFLSLSVRLLFSFRQNVIEFTYSTVVVWLFSLSELSGIFWLSISNSLGQNVTETASSGNTGRGGLPRESTSQRTTRETDPTPVVTRSSEASRVEPIASMVTRSRARVEQGAVQGGRMSLQI